MRIVLTFHCVRLLGQEMETSAPRTQVWRFGVFEVDAHREELRRAGVPVKLREQSFRILLLLLEHANELVAREELRKALWPADTFVDFEHSLNAAVMKLREALGDQADKPLYIETIPKRGYRFIAPLVTATETRGDASTPDIQPSGAPLDDPPAQTSETPPPVRDRSRFGLIRWSAAVTVILVALAATVWFLRRPLPLPRITAYVQLTNDGLKKELQGTDGNNLYVNALDAPYGIAQVPISGGPLTRISVKLPTATECCPPRVRDVSASGLGLLVQGHGRALYAGDIWVVGTSGHPARYLTVGGQPAWSPDGKLVAFAYNNGDIGVISAGGGEPRRVSASGAPAGQAWRILNLAWSPDGRRIRFTRDNTIWEISSSGSAPRKVLPSNWSGASMACCGRWTLDGDFYIFLSGRTILKVPASPPVGQMWALDERRKGWHSKESQPFQLAQGPTQWGAPTLSRDGQTIFSRGITPHGKLVRLDGQTNQFEPFLGGASAEFVAFSRDGNSVAYVSFPDGILWRANRDGTGLTQLTRPPFYPKSVRWSPDGHQILFSDYSPQLVDAIYTVAANGGGEPIRLLPQDAEVESDPNWSPDGKRIAYCAFSPYVSAGVWSHSEIHILDLETRQDIVLPPVQGQDIWSPRWSPDGRYIVGMNTAQSNLYLFDMQAQSWSVLTHGAYLNFPTWSHDGRSLYFLELLTDRNEAAIGRVAVKDRKAEQVVALKDVRLAGMYGFWFGLDPDDNPLLLRDEGTDEIYALTLERK